jgi:hypothetical protein
VKTKRKLQRKQELRNCERGKSIVMHIIHKANKGTQNRESETPDQTKMEKRRLNRARSE